VLIEKYLPKSSPVPVGLHQEDQSNRCYLFAPDVIKVPKFYYLIVRRRVKLHLVWGILIGIIGTSVKSEFSLYRFLVNRSKILWGEDVHRFHQLAGAIVAIFGTLVSAGLFN
jgi:hypothetical protein